MKISIRRLALVAALTGAALPALAAKGDKASAKGDKAPAKSEKEGGAVDPKAGTGTAKKDAAPDAKTAAKDAKKPEERKGPAGFTGGYELDENQRTVEADKKRDEAIDQLKRIIPRLDAGPQKSELLFQLAELWIEKQKYVYFIEMNAYDVKTRAWSECRDQKTSDQCGKEPREDTHQSELYRDEALRLYDQILKDDPTYPRKDEVLFALATNLYEKGRKRGAERPDLVAQAIQKHRDLITQYPNSKFVGDSYISLGEHFFGANDLIKARKAYEGALEASKEDPRVYNFALYKLAWCDYNGGDFEGSLQKFQKVVELSEQQKKKNEVALKFEALNDMVLAWQKLEAIEEANAYYKRKASSKDARRYFSKLAQRYYEDGGYDNAVKSFRILINEQPSDPKCPDFQNNIVRAFEGLRQRDKVFEEMKVLVANYKPGSAWYIQNKDNKPALDSAYAVTEEALRTLVTDYHQEAQKTKEVRTYRLARDIYKEYLDAFGQSEFAYNLNYYYAEILWTLEEWERAAGAYEQVYARDVNGSYAKTAAYNALLCYEKLVQIDSGELEKSTLRDDQKVDEKKDKGSFKATKKIVKDDKITKEAKEEKLSQWEDKLANACDRYADIASKDKRLEKDELNVRYKAAFIYYDRKHFADAARRFGDIILKWPTDPQAEKAADLSLNILEIREEWYDLARLSRAFYENKKLAKPGTKWTTDLAKIMEGSQYKYIDLVVYKQEQKKNEAATMFRDFVKEFPKSEYAAQALRYSLVIFNEAKKLDQAIVVGEQILAEYGESPFHADTVWDLAKFYQLTSNFQKASAYYEQFYTEWEQKEGLRLDPKFVLKKGQKPPPTKKFDDVVKAKQKDALKASDALYNAALWNEGLGNFEKAIKLYNEYIQDYSTVKGGIDPSTLAFNIVLIYEKQKDWTNAEKQLDAYLKNYEKTIKASEAFYARYKRSVVLQKLNRSDESMKIFEVLFKEFPKLKPEDQKKIDNLDAYAHAAFMLLEPKWKAYQAIKFNNVKNLKKDLKSKLDATPALIDDYTRVLQIGSADWGIAALTRIGMINQDFARNFVDSPDPPGLDEDQLEMYRSELENRAFPLEDKAIQAFEKSLGKSYELGIYNEYTIAAQDALNKFKPNTYGPVIAVNYSGSEFFSGADPALAIDQTFGGSKLEQKEVVKPEPAPVGDQAKGDTAKVATDGKDAKKDVPEEPAPEEKDDAPKKPKLILDKPGASPSQPPAAQK